VGRRCQEFIDRVVAEAEHGMVLVHDLSEHTLDTGAQVILKCLFDQYDGIRKVIRDFRTLGVIDDVLRPEELQYNLNTVVCTLMRRLDALVCRFDTKHAAQNNAVLKRISQQLIAYFFGDEVRGALLRICGKKSTRDATEFHARMTQELRSNLERVFMEAADACYESLFGKRDAEIRLSPRSEALDCDQFYAAFMAAAEQDKVAQRERIALMVEVFSKEESFIDCALSAEEELQKLMQKRVESYAMFCSAEAGALTMYALERESSEYAIALQAKFAAAKPMESLGTTLSVDAFVGAAAAASATTVEYTRGVYAWLKQ
jgi:hypothetical protein